MLRKACRLGWKHRFSIAFAVAAILLAIAVFGEQHTNRETRILARRVDINKTQGLAANCAASNALRATIDVASRTSNAAIRKIIDDATARSIASRNATIMSPSATAQQKAVAQQNVMQLQTEERAIDARIDDAQATIDAQTKATPCSFPLTKGP